LSFQILAALGKAIKWISEAFGAVSALYTIPRNWWTRRKLQSKVRQVAHIASRGIGGFKDPNISAVFIEPQRVIEIRADPQKTNYEIVQVNRDPELLLMQSSLHTLRDQFEELKEYLPLDAVYALEFVLLYPSLFEVSPKAARKAREEIERFSKERPGLSKWFERIAELHGGGNIAGLIMPYLVDVHQMVRVPNPTVRKECVRYIHWVCAKVAEIKRHETQISKPKTKTTQMRHSNIAFQSGSLGKKVAIVFMGDQNWSVYSTNAVSLATHACNRVILMAWGLFHAETALQASVALAIYLPAYSISRIVVTSRAGMGRVLALYVYVDSGRVGDTEMRFREVWGQSIALDASSVPNARFEMAQTGQCIVRNVGGELRSFLSVLFDLMSNTEAKITECSVWRESEELRILLRVSRLPET
jgi:hypothetical protein